jgi:hypothetical protein
LYLIKKIERKSPDPATVITKQNPTMTTSGNLREILSPETRQTNISGINPIPKLTKLDRDEDKVNI